MLLMDQTQITVFLADDNLLVREGVRALLSLDPDLEVVGVAADYDSLLAGAVAVAPQVLVTDIRMPPSFQREGIDALANKPTLVLADEPTGALDTAGGAEVLELFRRLHADGQAILMVTHDQEVADAADRIVTMRDGRIEDGTPVTPESPSPDLTFKNAARA